MSKAAIARQARAYPVRRVAGRKAGAGEFLALSSDGTTFYSLLVDGQLRVACDPRCDGFRFRRDCRHVRDVSAALVKEIESMPTPIRPEAPRRPDTPREPVLVGAEGALEDDSWADSYL